MQTELEYTARFPELLYEPLSETRKRRQSKFSASTSVAEPNAVPAVSPEHRVPYAFGDRVKVELNRMEKLQVITKVDTPTE